MSENFLQFPSRDLAEIHLCSTILDKFDRLFPSRRKVAPRRLCGEEFSDGEEFSWNFHPARLENFSSDEIFTMIFKVKTRREKLTDTQYLETITLPPIREWWIPFRAHVDIFQSRNPSRTKALRGFIQLPHRTEHSITVFPSRSASLRKNAAQKKEKKNENTVVYELMSFYSVKFTNGLLKYLSSRTLPWMGSIFRMGMNVLKWKVRITPTVPKNLSGLLCRYHCVSNKLSGIREFNFHTLGWTELTLPREHGRNRPYRCRHQAPREGEISEMILFTKVAQTTRALRDLSSNPESFRDLMRVRECATIPRIPGLVRKIPENFFTHEPISRWKKYFSSKLKMLFRQLLHNLAIASSKGGFKRNLVKVQWTTRLAELKWKRIGKFVQRIQRQIGSIMGRTELCFLWLNRVLLKRSFVGANYRFDLFIQHTP